MKPPFPAPLILLLTLTTASAEHHNPTTRAHPFHLYDGFQSDLAQVRKTETLSPKDAKPIKASSPQAVAAARRIFQRVSFLFHTRAQILTLLGDPTSVSDYNKPAPSAGPLTYRFDTGYNGFQVTITFDDSDNPADATARQITVDPLE